MTNHYLRILQELEDSGIGEKKDISLLLLTIFPEPESRDEYEVNLVISAFMSLLDKLEGNNHIEYSKNDLNNTGISVDRNQPWFGRPFNIAITALGLEYLNKCYTSQSIIESNKSFIKTNDSVIETNRSVKETNKSVVNNLISQSRLFWLTLTVAIIGAVSQVFTVVSDVRNKNLSNQIEQLKKDALKKNITIQQLRNPLHSLKNKHPVQKEGKN